MTRKVHCYGIARPTLWLIVSSLDDKAKGLALLTTKQALLTTKQALSRLLHTITPCYQQCHDGVFNSALYYYRIPTTRNARVAQ